MSECKDEAIKILDDLKEAAYGVLVSADEMRVDLDNFSTDMIADIYRQGLEIVRLEKYIRDEINRSK